ncbi:MAG TPA: hypothetical protein VFS43_37815 [Polyangiaceae bacterium]|nr:hypothetical protein [Polyangiaceae bacterium]
MTCPPRPRPTRWLPLCLALPTLLACAAAAPGCNDATAADTSADAQANTGDETGNGAGAIDLPAFSTEWATAVPVLGDWLSCGATGAPISDAKVSVRGGRFQQIGEPAALAFLATFVVSVSGNIDVHNLPLQGVGHCTLDLFNGNEFSFPPAGTPPLVVPGTAVTTRILVKPLATLELSFEDVANMTASVPFELSTELGAATFSGFGGRFVPYTRVLSAKFGPTEASFGGAFKGGLEGNLGVGATFLFNEVVGLSFNAYFEPNFSWDLPLSGCDLTYSISSRGVIEGCLGVQTPPSFPAEFEAGFCGQLKGDPLELKRGKLAIFRTAPDEGFKVAPGASITLPVLANDTCLGGGRIVRVEGVEPQACAIDSDGQTLTYAAVTSGGEPRAPGFDVGRYCVRSPVDNRERCQDFTVGIECPADTKWDPDARACRPCSSPEECACAAPRAWDGVRCGCPAEAPVFDPVANACAPCAVEGSTYDPATNQCACGAPRQSDGFRCQCPREAPNFVAATNECQACPPNMVHNGQTCVCVEPAFFDGTTCTPPCTPPSQWDGYECRCPPGVPFEQCFPEPACPPPASLENGVCRCPPGADCAAPPGGGSGGGLPGGVTGCVAYECSFRMNRGGCSLPSPEDGTIVTTQFTSCGTSPVLAPNDDGCGVDDVMLITDSCGAFTSIGLTSCCNANTEMSCRPLGRIAPACN